MTALAAGGLEDLLARRASPVSFIAGNCSPELLDVGSVPTHGLRRGGLFLAVEAPGAEQAEREREHEDGDEVGPAHHGGV